ncbi:DUF1553 domain-containing protein [Luteolibacter sp. GHJ8]|uniref:DUF1553 domain-containing protein n=1 Tax=Luteolibacter rhizosphaerae TaxID=2989719 RepID=A0ABT3G0X0_9BACT|nr:DUF1553 domain-containing protein [Luteolibacter rhizosphaerae]MCW1912875.1 DUF1553 domain-containing protein [Luteolibacter rhizosphaerae]
MSRFLLIPALAVASAAKAEVSYAYEIRPILSDKCFACHGPDGGKREADLRLDTAEGATASAIVPGDPGKSEAWQRILSQDPEELMPPPSSHLSLTNAEKALIKRWIEEGAKYQPHWSFQPLPESVAVPQPQDAAWGTQTLDRFVLARLEQEQLKPSPAADPLRWLRRASLDLTGLPPTTEEITNFQGAAATDFPAAKAAAVERLLASPRFGEHFAVPWLDAARYADSYGYQSDQLTAFWPWRDWVLRSLNENLPIDRFISWQVAGDLLPDATREQKLATTFNRLHRLTNEGGSVAQEFLVENMADRVHTFGSVFLALTMECTRCHDHKYDPIGMRDYYSLGAFFNSIPERGFYTSQGIQPSPGLLLPNAEQESAMAAAKERISAASAAVEARRAASDPELDAWLAGAPVAPLGVDLVSHQTFDDGVVKLDGDSGVPLPGVLAHDRCDPFSVDLVIRDTVANPEPVILLHRSFGTDVGYNGLELFLAGGRLEARVVRDWPGNALGVRSEPVVTKDQWVRITWTYDGSSNTNGIKLYVDGKPVPVEITADEIYKSIATPSHGDGTATIGQRFRDRGFAGGEVDEIRVFKRELGSLEVAALQDPAAWQAALADPVAHRAELREAWLRSSDTAFREALEKLRLERSALIAAEEKVFEIPVMKETPHPVPAHVLARGAYDAPRSKENEIGRDVFSQILIPFPEDAPRDRLGLAKWLVDPRHPLTSRVFVNRVWANFFGSGIVETTDNFGLQGSLPSHPELLDWLARDFISGGWDLKKLCRSIVLSSTYGQDSRMRSDLARRDPANRLLARATSRRLSSEQIRDLALASSDLLQQQDGGPPVSPYQPGGDLWRESNSMSPAYHQSKGADLYRRSLYSVWKRTAPLPNMLAFDSPTREVCTIRRPQTNTPLQALVLLNDEQFVEAARALAMKVSSLPPERRFAEAFIAATSRPPTDKEAALLDALHREQLELFKATPEEAKKILAIGEGPAPPDLDPVEAAALTVVCQAILNLDASVWSR